MLWFPQLSQYPARKRRIARTRWCEAADGRVVKAGDAQGAAVEWTLRFSELSEEERSALEDLFQAAEGRRGSFTFLDPLANLAAWSEQLDQAVWARDPLLSATEVEPAIWRIANSGQAPQSLLQTLAAPGWYIYCASARARAGSGTLVRGELRLPFTAGPEWMRVTLGGQTASSGETAAFGVEVAPGAALDLTAFQVEAQRSVSKYRKTGARSGIYPSARFTEDELRFTATGFGRHSCIVKIHANDF